MSSIGETLRRERLRRNLDLEQISRELKISHRFLEAIEDERFDRLPAGVFAKSFVRQYATLLGFDGDELAAEVQQALEPPAPVEATSPGVPPIADIHVPRVEQWEAVSDRRSRDWSSALPAAALVVVVMLVCSGVYAFWQRARHTPTTTAQAPPPATQTAPAVQPPAVQPPQEAAAQPPQVQAQPQTQPGAPLNPEPAIAAQTPKPAPAAGDNPPAATKPATPPNEAARMANPNAPVRVQLTAGEPVWVLARADGKYIFSGTLDANQTKSVDANEAVTLRLGNAGGISITLNGKPVGPVGPKGQVREVQFTSGGFHIVAAPKPSLPLDNPI
jgi:cytoskeleton protein RodZ